MLLLSRSDAKRILSMPEAIDAVKGAFTQLSTGRADIPLRAAVPQKAHDGLTSVHARLSQRLRRTCDQSGDDPQPQSRAESSPDPRDCSRD